MNYFFSADHHFDHKNIIKYCNRPFESVAEMNEELISRHNSVVGKDDTVVIAGDFYFGNDVKKAYEFKNKLNGNIIILRGSHDRWMLKGNGKSYFRHMWFKHIDDQFIVVCHYAMRVWQASHYNSWHLYGHSHGKLDKLGDYGKCMDVGVDTNDFYPYSFEEIKEIMAKKPNNPNLVKDKDLLYK